MRIRAENLVLILILCHLPGVFLFVWALFNYGSLSAIYYAEDGLPVGYMLWSVVVWCAVILFVKLLVASLKHNTVAKRNLVLLVPIETNQVFRY